MRKVWYITGASKGLGLALVKYLLQQGQQVAATSRHQAELVAAVGVGPEAPFLPLEVDLTSEASIAASLAAAHQGFGRLDVIVNNAGYGITGALEELSTAEITQSINLNLVANIQVVRQALPYLRQQRAGNIITISSIGGFVGALGWSVYSAAKFGVMGYSQVLAQDVRELGIKVTVVAPGGFRTSFLAEGSPTVPATRIDDYAAVHASQARVIQTHDHQPGDPDKLAKVLLELVENPEPPVVLSLRPDAYERASQQLEVVG